jgi:hypothetical protein
MTRTVIEKSGENWLATVTFAPPWWLRIFGVKASEKIYKSNRSKKIWLEELACAKEYRECGSVS